MKQKIGFTTTVPHEIIVAAGFIPVDLNNLFIADEDCGGLLEQAEMEGFPPGVCAWIKGIYAAVKKHQVSAVVAVLTGDCSNTGALAEVLAHRGVRIIPFSYPNRPDAGEVERALEDLAHRLQTDLQAAELVRRSWQPLRRRLVELDRLAWQEGKVSSQELHDWLVSASDFNGDANAYEHNLETFLAEATQRKGRLADLRLGLLGVPPIFTDFFSVLERSDARMVFTEVPRQFAMPYECGDLVEQFCRYTYPYDLAHRLVDLELECAQRKLDGVINYLQAFCHRQIENIVLGEKLPVPLLALEGDRPGPMGGQAVTRLEAFLEMLR